MTAGPVGSPARQKGLMPGYRYIPLALMTSAVIVLGATGAALTAGGSVTNGGGTPAPPFAPPVLEIVDGEEDPALDQTCQPELPTPSQEPWSAENAASSEAIWQENAEALALPYLPGENGFVFWGDIQNNNIAQALGRRTLSADELQLWIDSLRTVRDELEAQGVDFLIVPGPGKWDVYPKLLPAWARPIDGSGPLEQLLRAAPDLPIVDLRADLRAAAEQEQVYSSVNSHWSDYGAWVGWQSIVTCLHTIDPRFASIEPPSITGVGYITGGNEFGQWGFEAAEPDWSVPLLATPLTPVEVAIDGRPREMRGDEQRIGLEEMPSTVRNPDAQRDETVLFLRDSMGTSLTPWIQQAFSEVRQMRHAFDMGDPAIIPDIAEEARTSGASIVILQFAQRHLNAPPDLRN